MFVHGEFYERNAGCMQGVDAGMHVVCRLHFAVRSLHTIVCSLHACRLRASVAEQAMGRWN